MSCTTRIWESCWLGEFKTQAQHAQGPTWGPSTAATNSMCSTTWVVCSFVQNYRRLATVGAFIVLIMLLYSMSAFMLFESYGDLAVPGGMGDENGQCKTLFQCFISYSYRCRPFPTLLPNASIRARS